MPTTNAAESVPVALSSPGSSPRLMPAALSCFVSELRSAVFGVPGTGARPLSVRPTRVPITVRLPIDGDVGRARGSPGLADTSAWLMIWPMVSVGPTENPTTDPSAVAVEAPVAGSCTAFDVEETDTSPGLPRASPTWASASLPLSSLLAARWRGPLSWTALGAPGYWLWTMNGYGGRMAPNGPMALKAPMRAGTVSAR